MLLRTIPEKYREATDACCLRSFLLKSISVQNSLISLNIHTTVTLLVAIAVLKTLASSPTCTPPNGISRYSLQFVRFGGSLHGLTIPPPPAGELPWCRETYGHAIVVHHTLSFGRKLIRIVKHQATSLLQKHWQEPVLYIVKVLAGSPSSSYRVTTQSINSTSDSPREAQTYRSTTQLYPLPLYIQYCMPSDSRNYSS